MYKKPYNKKYKSNYNRYKYKYRGIFIKWDSIVKISIAISIITILYIILSNNAMNIMIIPVVSSILIVVLHHIYKYNRCPRCNNCFALKVIGDKELYRYNEYENYTSEQQVGRGETRYHYMNGGSRITYTDKIFAFIPHTRITPYTKHEETYQCKICGHIKVMYYTHQHDHVTI